uniref:Uncharacterized protein n=1 Tax=Romanomermis culicivorax TaxID=13658 RepID=A0A915INQ5_ROMCU
MLKNRNAVNIICDIAFFEQTSNFRQIDRRTHKNVSPGRKPYNSIKRAVRPKVALCNLAEKI